MRLFYTGPAVIAAVVSAIVSIIGVLINRFTMLKMHNEKIKNETNLMNQRNSADIDLAERKFRLDIEVNMHKRRQELAENVLSEFYQLADTINTIRSPMSYADEASGRPGIAGESDGEARMRDAYYVPLARIHKHRQVIGDLMAKRYRMVAWFGRDAIEPFDIMNRCIVRISTAAETLLEAGGEELRKHDPEFHRSLLTEIWLRTADKSKDAIELDIKNAIEMIEGVCKPALES